MPAVDPKLLVHRAHLAAVVAAEARVLNIAAGVAELTFAARAARRQDEVVLLWLHW
jgi:hypothetical protein